MADPTVERLWSLIRQLQGQSKITFPYASGWTDFGGALEGASYSHNGRVVLLQGLATKSGGTPTAGNVIGTLPAGVRPTGDLIFVVHTGATQAVGRVDVNHTGDVVWQSGNTTEPDYTSLSGIAFVVD